MRPSLISLRHNNAYAYYSQQHGLLLKLTSDFDFDMHADAELVIVVQLQLRFALCALRVVPLAIAGAACS
jgi:hypothetical protein